MSNFQLQKRVVRKFVLLLPEMEKNTTEKIKIAVVDDHGLYRKGLINLIHSLSDRFDVAWQASNGQAFLDLLPQIDSPDLVIMDIDMPLLNGFETATLLQTQQPQLPILIVSMMEDETSLIQMLKLGVKGFMSKDVEPEELKKAIENVAAGQFHHNEALTTRLIQALHQNANGSPVGNDLLDHELEFLRFCCTELTYKEIADKMYKSPKTIDGYRAQLFEKLGAKSRVGLVMYALKQKLVLMD